MTSGLPPFSNAPAFALTQAPNPQWKFGQSVAQSALGKDWENGELDGWKVIETEKEDKMAVYRLMISGIIPRPIAFVSTLAADGTANLAPFSWFNMVTHNPPSVSISTNRLSPTQGKDTLENIKATKTFTVNIISEPWLEQANFASIDSPAHFSEWEASGLTKAPSTQIKPARVKESAFSMECELYQLHDLCPVGSSDPSTTLILGLVKVIHVRKDVLDEQGTVDPAKFRAVSRLGGLSFGRIGEGFDVHRHKWEAIKEELSAFIPAKRDT